MHGLWIVIGSSLRDSSVVRFKTQTFHSEAPESLSPPTILGTRLGRQCLATQVAPVLGNPGTCTVLPRGQLAGGTNRAGVGGGASPHCRCHRNSCAMRPSPPR